MTTTTSRLFTRELVGLSTAFVLGAILTILDATIVNVALPEVGRALDASIATIQWVPAIYLLAFAGVIPLTGWLTDRYGVKRTWLASLAVFILGSFICAVAQSVPQLLAGRVVQGLGGGLVLPVGQTMLARVAGPQRMGRVMSIVGVPMLLAPIAGPVIGGALVGAAGWRWVFLLNLPVGAVAVAAALRLVPSDDPARTTRLDVRGLALLPTGLVASVYGLADAAARGSVTAARPIAALLLGASLLFLYVVHGRATVHPLVDVRLFTRRSFGSAAVTNFVLGAGLFAVMLLLPLYLEIVRGRSALQTGLLLIPQGVGAAVAMPIAGALTDRIGPRRVVVAGTIVAAAGTAMFTQLSATTQMMFFCAALALVGAGLGATITPAMAAAFRDLDHASMPHASSAIATVQRLAGSVGTALLSGVLQHRLSLELPGVGGSLDAAHHVATTDPGFALPHLAAAFAATFVVAVTIAAAAVLPALLLPGRPEQTRHAVRDHAQESAGDKESTMAVTLNHTIVAARDKHASAAFIAEILGVEVGEESPPFVPVPLANGVTLDYMTRDDVRPQHYAFLLDDAEWDAAYDRLRERGVRTWADPDFSQADEVNTRWGGRGVYFRDPDGHSMEIMTAAPDHAREPA